MSRLISRLTELSVARSSASQTVEPSAVLAERLLFLGLGVLCLIAAALPAIHQDQAYHHFADTRTLLGVPNALDVLSNVGFLAIGLHGLVLMARERLYFFSAALKLSAFVTFTGFILTGAGSAYYHLAPGDSGLVLDRLGMVIAFAGVLGMAAAQRISDRAARAMLVLILALGALSVASWQWFGTLTPYVVVQFGGIVLAISMLLSPARGPGPNWAMLMAAYALAKLFEVADHAVFEWTNHLVSGHTLKHLIASIPGLAVTTALSISRGINEPVRPAQSS